MPWLKVTFSSDGSDMHEVEANQVPGPLIHIQACSCSLPGYLSFFFRVTLLRNYASFFNLNQLMSSPVMVLNITINPVFNDLN